MRADLADLVAQAQEILQRIRLLPGIAQQRRRMERAHHPDAVLFDEFAVLLRDAEVRVDDPLCRDPAEADDDLRTDQPDLLAQPEDARILLLRLRIAVLRRAAFDHVADIDIAPARQADRVEVFVQKLAASADERLAAQILLLAGSLADEHDLRIRHAHAEHEIRARFTQSAARTGHAVSFQVFPVCIHNFLRSLLKRKAFVFDSRRHGHAYRVRTHPGDVVRCGSRIRAHVKQIHLRAA